MHWPCGSMLNSKDLLEELGSAPSTYAPQLTTTCGSYEPWHPLLASLYACLLGQEYCFQPHQLCSFQIPHSSWDASPFVFFSQVLLFKELRNILHLSFQCAPYFILKHRHNALLTAKCLTCLSLMYPSKSSPSDLLWLLPTILKLNLQKWLDTSKQ